MIDSSSLGPSKLPNLSQAVLLDFYALHVLVYSWCEEAHEIVQSLQKHSPFSPQSQAPTAQL